MLFMGDYIRHNCHIVTIATHAWMMFSFIFDTDLTRGILYSFPRFVRHRGVHSMWKITAHPTVTMDTVCAPGRHVCHTILWIHTLFYYNFLRTVCPNLQTTTQGTRIADIRVLWVTGPAPCDHVSLANISNTCRSLSRAWRMWRTLTGKLGEALFTCRLPEHTRATFSCGTCGWAVCCWNWATWSWCTRDPNSKRPSWLIHDTWLYLLLVTPSPIPSYALCQTEDRPKSKKNRKETE